MYFDLHYDIWNNITLRRLEGETNVFDKYHLEKFRKGNVEGTLGVMWVDPPFDRDYAARTKQIFECIRAELAEAKNFRIVHNMAEIEQARKDNIFYILMGVEGMAYIGDDLSKIDEYYEIGARHAILTWNEANKLGAGANSGQTYGLTDAGKKAVRLLEDKGMLIDVSHLNDTGFYDLAKIATKPFIASHSNCRELCGVARNLTDDQIKVIGEMNGTIGLNSFNIFINSDPEKQNCDGLARHADRIISLAGIDHLSIGLDICDFMTDPATIASMTDGDMVTIGLEDHSKVPNFFESLKKLGLTKEELEKIAIKNAMRVIKETIG